MCKKQKQKKYVFLVHVMCAYTRVECKLVAFQIIISSSHIQVKYLHKYLPCVITTCKVAEYIFCQHPLDAF
jgi:hypothetical protein